MFSDITAFCTTRLRAQRNPFGTNDAYLSPKAVSSSSSFSSSSSKNQAKIEDEDEDENEDEGKVHPK